ncbi:PREDICTED: F-box protein At4g22390-like [Erythranthe guttata]|uniref:F-box protein At4g22390-like n=1 Tax=Erythranthe guttata TaxID=4155 RepID=UPI00064DDFEE|nr:PREDICTED: F-box protein At4g22390-like [Erythranthe guttata]|eukprot:XP_012844472.1 PREDICTED: F-box protein At4g22390-like [Erythranthe guttata]
MSSYIHNNEHPGFPLVKFEEGGKVCAGEVLVENIPNGYNRILCECNGVLLLTNLYLPDECKYDRYVLWNPSSRREMFLINQCDLNEGYIVDYGICYDQITSDFKVIFIFLTKYAIYSCNNNSWTKKPGRKYHTMGGKGSGIFFDGATYWILGDNTNRSGRQLVYFDPRTDELKVLQRPEKVNNHDKYLLVNMGCLSGRLCLYCYNRVTKSVQMWIKEKGIDSGENSTNCWKEFITVENFNPPYFWSRPIFFVENKIVVQIRNNTFAFYSPNEKTVEEILEIDVSCGRVIPYRNSLYSPATIKA